MTAPTREGACDHLATKADVELVRVHMERFRAEIHVEFERLRAYIARGLLWLGIATISATGVITGIAVAVIKLT